MVKYISKEDFNDIYQKYHHFVLMISYSFFNNFNEAEDVLQEVFMRLLSKTPNLNNEAVIKSWLYKVTHNACITQLRKKKKISLVSDEALDIHCKAVENNYSDLKHHIFNLQHKYKVVIILYYYEDLSIKEIAAILKITESNVKKRLERARGQLKIKMEDNKNAR